MSESEEEWKERERQP
jgi:hypothetical protein